MNRKNFCMSLAVACLLGAGSVQAAFKDIKVDLTNGNLLTAEEIASKNTVTFGVAVADDGSVSRVPQGDASSAITLTGKYHSPEHGWGNFSSTVAVEGPVRISMGTCAWGGDVTVKDAAGTTVATFNTGTGSCWHNNGNLCESAIYRGDATTLTISGGSYTPYIAVEAVSDVPEPSVITFSLGDAQGIAPATISLEQGQTFTIPANFTVYAEGKTLVGWNDGTRNYEIGEIVTPTADMAFTPVFVDNTVTLADRTEEVTVRWDFQRNNGAPSVGFQNVDGFWVAQAKIGTETIDVKMDFSTSPGKIANANWGDWAQMNGGTTFKVPSCKGATISLQSYSENQCTVDGVVMTNTPNGNVWDASFTVLTPDDLATLVINGGSYFRYIQTVLPVVKSAGGNTFNNADASVVWAFNSADYMTDVTSAPEGAFSQTVFDQNGLTYKGTASTTMTPDVNYVRIASVNGGSDVVKWCVKPAKGLTFTPTSVSFYIARNGTDGAGDDVTVKGEVEGGASEQFATITPHRNNKTQADDKHGSRDNYTIHFEYTLTAAQQQALKSGNGFNLVLNNGYASNKDCMYSDVHINGIIDGTSQEVAMYTLSAKANPEEAARITIYPSLDQYEAETVVSLKAERNFGYEFVNWTDAEGKVVAETAEFSHTMAANVDFTANLNAINTYELKLGVEGGANSYQVQPSPAPVMVDGKMMYEDGTKVTVKAISNPVMSFTNWSDGQSSSEISFVMDGDKELKGVFSASDFIVGWDFYLPGNNGRAADFHATDNDAVALVLRDADGNLTGWLDKNESEQGGYEGRPAGVNWKTDGLGTWYWQTTVNAAAFTDIKVQGEMAYNYNAYTVYNVEASTDGENWEKIGTVNIEGRKMWKTYEYALPEKFNNQENLSIRWIADKSSPVDGTQSNNDGIAMGPTYITGAPKLINDGTAPVLLSHVPAEGTDNASIAGRIVLNFDEKVKVAEGVKATLGEQQLEPTVAGKTVMFSYKNLAYGTPYVFTLPAGAVMDLCDNATDKEIRIAFSTRTKPEVTKALYDRVVTDVDGLVEAINAANTREDATKRFRIFIHNGQYKLPASTERTKTGSDGKAYPDPTTYITKGNISFIGESMEGVVITNTVPAAEGDNGFGAANVLEGIGNGDVMRLEKNATNCYFQNLTMKSSMGDKRGRDIVLNDNSDKTIFKDACLWAYQDTYVSNNQNGRFYFEGGVLRGRTDYLCGKGDVYYQAVKLQMCEKGGYLAVPSQPRKFGYIFNDCEIVGETSDIDGNYTLGRPWGSGTPIALYINTKMTVKPSAVGWNEMSGGWPARFAEYNSTTGEGTVIDLKDRKKTFGDGHANNPVLTREEAEAHTITTVMGDGDDWDPTQYSEQAPEPQNVKIADNVITWDNSQYASLWAVTANGKIIGFTLDNSYDLTSAAAVAAQDANDAEAIVYAVRAANEMGGLSEAVIASDDSAISSVTADSEVVDTVWYNLQGIRVAPATKGILVKVVTYADGTTQTTKVVVK